MLQENWDSYGARRIDTRAVNEAVAMIERFYRDTVFIAPCPSGGVLIEYEHAGRTLEIEVRGQDQYDVLWIQGPEGARRFYERNGLTRAEASILLDLFSCDTLPEGED